MNDSAYRKKKRAKLTELLIVSHFFCSSQVIHAIAVVSKVNVYNVQAIKHLKQKYSREKHDISTPLFAEGGTIGLPLVLFESVYMCNKLNAKH